MANTSEYYVQIIDFTPTSVEAIVLLGTKPTFVQTRNFSKDIFEGFPVKVNQFLKMKITIEPGKHIMEFMQPDKQDSELEKMFEPQDFFSQFKDSPFLNKNK